MVVLIYSWYMLYALYYTSEGNYVYDIYSLYYLY